MRCRSRAMNGTSTSARPLSALLSQLLVAFTVELDNEFERQMRESGYPGARLSLVVWTNLMRFIADERTVRELASRSPASESQVKFQVACLEWWGFVELRLEGPQPLRAKRDGWGSGRGIRAVHLVRLMSKGLAVNRIWPPLPPMIEERWRIRFGENEL